MDTVNYVLNQSINSASLHIQFIQHYLTNYPHYFSVNLNNLKVGLSELRAFLLLHLSDISESRNKYETVSRLAKEFVLSDHMSWFLTSFFVFFVCLLMYKYNPLVSSDDKSPSNKEESTKDSLKPAENSKNVDKFGSPLKSSLKNAVRCNNLTTISVMSVFRFLFTE